MARGTWQAMNSDQTIYWFTGSGWASTGGKVDRPMHKPWEESCGCCEGRGAHYTCGGIENPLESRECKRCEGTGRKISAEGAALLSFLRDNGFGQARDKRWPGGTE